jgi:hypothetical protein
VRKIISWLCLVVGAFLVTAAVISTVWATDAAKKTPLDTDTTTRLTGTALVPTKSEDELDVKATSITKADSEKSDDEVIVFVNTSCLVLASTPSDCGEEGTGENADPNVISISQDIFATDRRNAEAVNDEKYLPEDAVPHEGLVNKFPVDTEKKDYEFWDGILRASVPIEYQGTEEIEGLETYLFQYSVEEVPATVIADIDGLYSMTKQIWADPRTGKIIRQKQSEVRTTTDGDVLLDLSLEFTDDTVAANVEEAEDKIAQLDLLTKVIPLVGYIGGPILMVLGGFLLWTDARRKPARRGQSSSSSRGAPASV